MKKGKVYLVGAGPGDPGLMTVKGLDCLRHADVVIYDRLVEESVLNEARPDAEKVYVGKADGLHILEQDSISQLLLEKARQGKVVVRLKGGDPFVLGRGGEEAGILSRHGIPFEVVPGVTSASAVPAYAGIPVTHRGVASSFAVITGHKASDRGEPRISWDKLATGADTLIILMGMRNLAEIVDQLIQHGRPPSTPIAVVTQGTTPRQKCLVGTLEDIVAKVKMENLKPPSVIIVGEVVRFRDHLLWFENPEPL
jgi:uroporphyrinogen III methyltransferase/synthase